MRTFGIAMACINIFLSGVWAVEIVNTGVVGIGPIVNLMTLVICALIIWASPEKNRR